MIGKRCCCGSEDCPCTGAFNYFQIVFTGWAPGDNPSLYADLNGTHLVPVENSTPHEFPAVGRCWGDITFGAELLRPAHPDFPCDECTELEYLDSSVWLYARVSGFGFPTITNLDLEARLVLTGNAKNACYGTAWESYQELWRWTKRIAVSGCTDVSEILTLASADTYAGIGGCTIGNLDDSGVSCELSLIL